MRAGIRCKSIRSAVQTPWFPYTRICLNDRDSHATGRIADVLPFVPPHGGLTEPVCRTVPADEIDDFLARAKTLAKVPVSDADLSTVYRLGDGGLSPLTGPMDSATYNRVLDESVIAAQRQTLRLDHSAGLAGRGRVGRPAEGRPRGGPGRHGRPASWPRSKSATSIPGTSRGICGAST